MANEEEKQSFNERLLSKVAITIHNSFIWKIHSGHKLKLYNRSVKEADVLFPPDIYTEVVDINPKNITDLHVREIIDNFTKVIVNNFDSDLLANFYNNINDVEIKKNYANMIISGCSGIYSGTKKNIIKYLDLKSLPHELFHMSSFSYQDGVYYNGFSQFYSRQNKDGKKEACYIGFGLSEGYTELLTERYFKDDEIIKAYKYETVVASCVEKIVGPDIMAKCYFKNNLYYLINTLGEYSSEKEANKFILNVDRYNRYSLYGSQEEKEKLGDISIEIKDYLVKCYIEKLKKDNNEEIDKLSDEFKQVL